MGLVTLCHHDSLVAWQPRAPSTEANMDDFHDLKSGQTAYFITWTLRPDYDMFMVTLQQILLCVLCGNLYHYMQTTF